LLPTGITRIARSYAAVNQVVYSVLFAEWADQKILVIGTHFAAPTAGHVIRDGAAFRFAV
jgi:hypothetical protein